MRRLPGVYCELVAGRRQVRGLALIRSGVSMRRQFARCGYAAKNAAALIPRVAAPSVVGSLLVRDKGVV
jgi:hypothetical protein